MKAGTHLLCMTQLIDKGNTNIVALGFEKLIKYRSLNTILNHVP